MALITILAVVLTALAVAVFIALVVRRPILRLEHRVARLGRRDDDPHTSGAAGGELGRLTESVNRMRDRINIDVAEITEARARLDAAVSRVSSVSRALTGTTLGVSELEREVVVAAAALGGAQGAAWLALRESGTLVLQADHAETGDAPPPPRAEVVERLLAGDQVSADAGEAGGQRLLAVPMFYQGEVVGALGVVAPDELALAAEQDVLAVLANNAAIARENARLFEQERETVRRLRELDAMKTDFLATIQHELRTPLTAILGLADLLEMCWTTWTDEAKLGAVRDVQVAATNLHAIVETIIDFSALDGETLGLSPGAVEVRSAVEAALVMVGERYKRGIEVPVAVDIDQNLSVFADPERFGQILCAVIDNAVKFSDGQGSLHIAARARDRRHVRVEVSDQGIGIAGDDLPHVFDRFYQADNTSTRSHGGTGMGLALVRRLAAAHGAKVDIKSSVGKGTSVTIDWPSVPAGSGGEARKVAEERGEVAADQRSRHGPALPVQ